MMDNFNLGSWRVWCDGALYHYWSTRGGAEGAGGSRNKGGAQIV